MPSAALAGEPAQGVKVLDNFPGGSLASGDPPLFSCRKGKHEPVPYSGGLPFDAMRHPSQPGPPKICEMPG